jgi:hypothetical protein
MIVRTSRGSLVKKTDSVWSAVTGCFTRSYNDGSKADGDGKARVKVRFRARGRGRGATRNETAIGRPSNGPQLIRAEAPERHPHDHVSDGAQREAYAEYELFPE